MSEEDDRRRCLINPAECKPGMTPASALKSLLLEKLSPISLATLGGWSDILDRVIYEAEGLGLLADPRPAHSEITLQLKAIMAAIEELNARFPLASGTTPAPAAEPSGKKAK